MPDGRDRFIRLLLLLVFAQFLVIALLLGSLSNEYLSNAYFQAWVARDAPILGVLLHGELDALFVGVAIGATVLIIQQRLRDIKAKPERRSESRAPVTSYLPTPVWAITDPDSDLPLPDHIGQSRKKKTEREESPGDTHKEVEKKEF